MPNARNINNIFQGCTNLVNVPVYNIPSAISAGYSFLNCPNLSNESLNNIMGTLLSSNISDINYKNLKSVGLSQTQATTCQTLSNWDAFVAAGWSTGY